MEVYVTKQYSVYFDEMLMSCAKGELCFFYVNHDHN